MCCRRMGIVLVLLYLSLHAAQLLMLPGGALFPSHATLFLAPVGSAKACREKQQTFDGERQSDAYEPQTI